MTQAKLNLSFAEYLDWSSNPANYQEGQLLLIDGELVAVPPESGVNCIIANRLFFLLVATGIVPLELVHPGQCEVQVPVLQPQDPANRYPDLVILRPEHLALTQKRLTITLDMPSPRLVAEILSPGPRNQERDRVRKRDQYAAREIPECWLVDPEQQTVTVLQGQHESYREVGVFQASTLIVSPSFANLQLTPSKLFQVGN